MIPCPVCGAPGERWVHHDRRDLIRCRRCRFAWVPQGVMRTEAGTSIYEGDEPIFFTEAQRDYYRDEATVEAARAKVEWVSGYVAPGGRLLDVGANFGHFVQQASQRYDAIGIEPSAAVVAWGREHLGARLEVGSIEHQQAEFVGGFDAVVLFDVIEHLPDPRQALRHCHSYLAPGGRLFITTPDAGSPMARLLGRHWYYVDLVEHVSLFSRTNLTQLLSETGFSVVAARTFGRRYRVSYIERRLRELTARNNALKIVAALARPLAWFPSHRVAINFGDVIGIVARRAP
jgi:2-polyprenyl-3-methyl-5-hydroxy-6-metoxy-1,4-benzoquinol methylase